MILDDWLECGVKLAAALDWADSGWKKTETLHDFGDRS